ncbi:MAG: hypothetical protein ACD_2C00007G0006 [uncultured bacterium (gcode 4)]|uniref:AAA+ ATPase domain-containing protein n=1 Tax=uncultured bacterium (gcode 4) TaxID=1234023 RepID=K2GIN7_9BACT|nr:MAG: hypothetical protein ACD_2C00007G0006 [uncultured bacterium (gcode 4)]
MPIKMENLRFEQIRALHMSRAELIEQIELKNKPIIREIWDDNIKRFIVEKIAEMSTDDIENIKLKLLKYEWIKTPKSLKLVQVFYNLLTKKILLPELTDYKDYWNLKEALNWVLQRYNRKLNDKIINFEDKFFNISFWDPDSFHFYLDLDSEVVPREFKIGWIFWTVILWFNEDERRFVIEIPIKSGIKKSLVEQKHVDADQVKELLSKYFPKKADKGSKYFDFKYKFWVKIDRDERYWTDSDASYQVITIHNTQCKELSEAADLSKVTIEEFLKRFIEVANLVVNDIAKLSSINHGRKHFSFYTSSPFLYVEWASTIKEEIDQKFSKLLVKMQKPVYMTDIWGQEKAKREIEKIILGIKHKDVMEQWGWKTTSWVLLYGPPGTGKTLLAMVIATEVNADVYNIKMTDIAESALINDGARNVKEMFDFIRHKAKENPGKKIVIILDEMDALLKKRTWIRQSDEDKKIVNTFLAEMSWFDTIDNVIFIWTTNNYHSLDAAVKRSWRFSTKVKIDLPDETWRKEIFSIHMIKAKRAAKRKDIFTQLINLSELSRQTESLSWADIEELIRMTIEEKAIEQIKGIWTWKDVELISDEDIIRSINEMKTSNWKANEIIKSFSIESLIKELKWANGEFLREAITKILTDKTVAEMQSAVDSGKISTAQLLEICNLTSWPKTMGFWAEGK